MEELIFKCVGVEEYRKAVEPHFSEVFSNRIEQPPQAFYSEKEVNKLDELTKNVDGNYRLFVLAYVGDKLVGWHNGQQQSFETYYMRNSAILEEYRGKSYYELMLKFIMSTVLEKGFQLITSLHHPNNPAVLIPKLRNGFVITSTEMNDNFGFLVRLSYFANEERRKSFDKRLGLQNVPNIV